MKYIFTKVSMIFILLNFFSANAYANHEDRINGVDFSPDGKFIATGSADETLKIWSYKSGDLIKTIKTSHRINTVKYSPDGKYLLSGGYGGTIFVWRTDTWKKEKEFKINNRGDVNSIRFSPDGSKFIASSFIDKTLSLWDFHKGKEIRSFYTGYAWHTYIKDAFFIENGEKVISSSLHGIRIIDVRTGKETDKFDYKNFSVFATAGAPYSLDISPDGRHIVSGQEGSGRINIWDIKSKKKIYTLNGFVGKVYSVHYIDNGRKIISGSDGGVQIWSSKTGELIKSIRTPAGTSGAVNVSKNKKLLAVIHNDKTGDGIYKVKLLDLTTYKFIMDLYHKSKIDSFSYEDPGVFVCGDLKSNKDNRVVNFYCTGSMENKPRKSECILDSSEKKFKCVCDTTPLRVKLERKKIYDSYIKLKNEGDRIAREADRNDLINGYKAGKMLGEANKYLYKYKYFYDIIIPYNENYEKNMLSHCSSFLNKNRKTTSNKTSLQQNVIVPLDVIEYIAPNGCSKDKAKEICTKKCNIHMRKNTKYKQLLGIKISDYDSKYYIPFFGNRRCEMYSACSCAFQK